MSTDTAGRRSDTKRGKYAVAIDPRLVEQIDAAVVTGFFRSRSHGFEEAIRFYLKVNDSRASVADRDSAVTA